MTVTITPRTRKFVAYFWFVDWHCLSLGLHIGLDGPHIEIHLPFGFLRIGWVLAFHEEKQTSVSTATPKPDGV